ncbi:MAG: hypothetical protein AAGG68_26920 [Bacteroidota bacterium]
MKKTHGNSLENNNPHHLYEIEDLQEKDTFKYGISDDPIEEDGLSQRVKRQVNFMNLIVGWIRFVGKILVFDISGRQKAKNLEDEYIDTYFGANGRNPRGNIRGGKRKKK